MKKINADLQGSPRMKKQNDQSKVLHELEISNVELSIEDFSISSDGGDIAILLGGFSEFATEYVKKFIMTKFNDQML